jgi:SHS2 domain-containing protein
MSYRFIEHMSDIIIEAKGRDFVKTLEDIADGMFVQMGGKEVKGKEKIRISTVASTKEDLVVMLLSDIIAQCEIENFTPKKIDIKKFDEEKNVVEAEILGEKKVPKNIIKAVTYHELKVEKTKDGWIIRVLFDI